MAKKFTYLGKSTKSKYYPSVLTEKGKKEYHKKHYSGSYGSGTSSGGGGSSGGGPSVQPIQQLPGGTYNPNTGVFTDINGVSTSTKDPSRLSGQFVTAQKKRSIKKIQ